MDESIKIFSYMKPLIPSGEYHISALQNIEVKKETREYKKEMSFFIQFPRFSIKDTDIYNCYPPENVKGNYLEQLPFIQFYKKTLPWIKSSDTTPWMALFIFEKDDPIIIKNETLKSFFNCPTDTIMTKIGIKTENYETENDACNFIEIDKTFFLEIAPTYEELSYLAHVKKVNLMNKSTDNSIPKEEISCLISNQYITVKSQLICLLSVEGIEDYLKDFKKLENYKYIRLPILKQWNINLDAEKFDFEDSLKQLDVGLIGLKDVEDPIINKGFIPMQHYDRIGNKLISWYHGPLISAYLPKLKYTHVDDYDEYLTFDPEQAMFDVSYSAAYQLGALIALKNKNIISILSGIRQQIQKKDYFAHQQKILCKHRLKSEEEIIEGIIKELGSGINE